MSFDLATFGKFARALRIDTKEAGIVRLGDRLLGTQQRFITQIDRGLREGVHSFTVLKCRQIGVSTASLALDLYWIFKHAATSAALVVHDDAARDQFRNTLTMYYEGLPNAYKLPAIAHNRNGFTFQNGSRLQYKVAGTRATGGGSLGRSAALAYLHATEVSSWGDEEGLASLRAALAEQNPNRLYIYESTARGFNLFYDLWEEAKRATTQRAVFITFWSNEYYRAHRDSDMYKAYWGVTGRMTGEEREWVKQVRGMYGHEVDAETLAWYRYMAAEKVGDPLMLMQEFPPTEEHAFIATGSQFFTARSISDVYKKLRHDAPPRTFRIQIGANFTDTQLVEVQARTANLTMWEQPDYDKSGKRGMYVLGADPAYGSSEWADRFAVSVWRCYSDRLVQVAEFVDPDLSTYSFAWVMVYLAGAYDPCLVNLEINGPGQAVLGEIQNLKRLVSAGKHSADAKTMFNVTRNIQNYLYRRLDSVYGGVSAIHTLTTHQMKERIMNTYRDYFERGILVPRSKALIDEMKGVVREEGAAPAATGRNKDDRVIAAALACTAWNDQARTKLMMQNASYEQLHQADQGAVASATARTVDNYLYTIGVKKRVEVAKPTAAVGRKVGT